MSKTRTLSHGKRVVITVAIVVALATIGVLVYLIGPGPVDFAGGKRVAIASYTNGDPTGVPAALAEETLVKKGEYLARAADCIECHTAKGGDAFAGGVAFALPFGTLYSTNITPDKRTGIGDLHRRGVRSGRPARRASGWRPALPGNVVRLV